MTTNKYHEPIFAHKVKKVSSRYMDFYEVCELVSNHKLTKFKHEETGELFGNLAGIIKPTKETLCQLTRLSFRKNLYEKSFVDFPISELLYSYDSLCDGDDIYWKEMKVYNT